MSFIKTLIIACIVITHNQVHAISHGVYNNVCKQFLYVYIYSIIYNTYISLIHTYEQNIYIDCIIFLKAHFLKLYHCCSSFFRVFLPQKKFLLNYTRGI